MAMLNKQMVMIIVVNDCVDKQLYIYIYVMYIQLLTQLFMIVVINTVIDTATNDNSY